MRSSITALIACCFGLLEVGGAHAACPPSADPPVLESFMPELANVMSEFAISLDSFEFDAQDLVSLMPELESAFPALVNGETPSSLAWCSADDPRCTSAPAVPRPAQVEVRIISVVATLPASVRMSARIALASDFSFDPGTKGRVVSGGIDRPPRLDRA